MCVMHNGLRMHACMQEHRQAQRFNRPVLLPNGPLGRARQQAAACSEAGSAGTMFDESAGPVVRKLADYIGELREVSAARELAACKQQLADHNNKINALRAQLQVRECRMAL